MVPAVYGLIAAGLVRQMDWQIPLFLDRSVTMLGDASIPRTPRLAGLQIAEARSGLGTAFLIGASAFLQLVVLPLIGLLLAHWMGSTAFHPGGRSAGFHAGGRGDDGPRGTI